MFKKITNSKIFFYLRLIFGIILLFLLLKMVDLQKVMTTIISAKPELVIIGFVGLLIDRILMAYRWVLLLWVKKLEIRFIHVVRIYFLSTFLGNFLPSTVAPDIVRIYCVSRSTSNSKVVISSMAVDRIIGNFSLAILTIIAFFILQLTGALKLDPIACYTILAFLLISIMLPFIIWHPRATGAISRLIRRKKRGTWSKKILEVCDVFLSYRDQRTTLGKVLLVAFLNQLGSILVVYVLALAFASTVSPLYFLLFVPLASFLAMLPVSIGGIGVLEGAIVFFFSRLGMSIETCLALALLYRTMLLVATLPGGIIYAVEGLSVKKISMGKNC